MISEKVVASQKRADEAFALMQIALGTTPGKWDTAEIARFEPDAADAYPLAKTLYWQVVSRMMSVMIPQRKARQQIASRIVLKLLATALPVLAGIVLFF